MLNPDNALTIAVPVSAPVRLVVRKARRHDIESLNALINALAAHHGDTATNNPARLENDLFGEMPWATAFVAETAGEIVGYALIYPVYRATEGERGIDLHQLYVMPQHRGAGVGRHLLAKVKAFASASGCAHVSVSAATGNFAAYKFYEGHGFKARPVTGMRFNAAL
ncbi:GNAT family N-acetyltransferase [Rhizobium sp. L1K21]|uniref:GNAT family N-acetyltransferase n=1 Tax=Rhizobium sp. L1K21 TaxID=2954933 RepID=UPI0020923B47|nr:GNAT family N-acetyltransferase [Rhizobium sp. L1K21]MCO6185682.1 GNAT family N-acetyltransferase [Rhizobium sp. L1K21]